MRTFHIGGRSGTPLLILLVIDNEWGCREGAPN
jgi:hypothetical protein